MRIYLFYSSENCRFSIEIWKTLEREGILSWFEKMNVLSIPLEQSIQLGMKEVPAIFIIDHNKRELYEGKRAFQWVNNIIQNRRQNMLMMVDSNRQRVLEKNRIINNNDGISEFSKNEMTGLSDDYTYLLTDMYQPKTYVGFDENNQRTTENAILTLNEGSKLTDQETKMLMKKEEERRKLQAEQLKEDMKIGQMEAVYDHKMMNKFT